MGNNFLPSHAAHKRSTSHVSKNAGQAAANATGIKEEATAVESKLQRPTFSTFQQHFSPKKVANPLQVPSTTLGTDEFGAHQHQMSAEDTRLQTELLQLHLLHTSSKGVSKDWENSAEQGLRRRFEYVASKYRALIEDEHLAQTSINQATLQELAKGGPATTVEDNIQCLSMLLQESLALTEEHGRHTRLYESFNRWLETAANMLQSPTMSFSDGLGENWKAEHAALTRKLTGMSRDADQLPDQSNDSSIAVVTLACKNLVNGMLDELRTMLGVEADVFKREQSGINEQLARIEKDITLSSQNMGPIWGTDA